jgi:hypothetical protein
MMTCLLSGVAISVSRFVEWMGVILGLSPIPKGRLLAEIAGSSPDVLPSCPWPLSLREDLRRAAEVRMW